MLLWHDGFETFDAGPYVVAGTFKSSTVTRFNYGYSLWSSFGGSGSIKKLFTPSAKVFAGVAVQPLNYYQWSQDLMGFFTDNGVTGHISIRPNANRGIDVLRGGTLIASSPNNVWADATWIYVEASVTIHDTVGEVHVRLNGATTDVISFVGDTRNGGTSTNIDAVYWGYPDVSESTRGRIDDIYVANDQGSLNNNFLGDVRVQALYPTGPGSSTAFTPSSGANWTCVDELPPSSSDYVASAVAGARDTYITQDLVNTNVVCGVRLVTYAHKTDAGLANLKAAIKLGSNVYYGATQALPAAMAGFWDSMELNPATNQPWTVAELNAAEIGAEVV